jgi:hypothetical protein
LCATRSCSRLCTARARALARVVGGLDRAAFTSTLC